MSPTSSESDPPPVPTGELACVGCGYELRGLAEDGTCPECGTAVERSRRGDRLVHANPEWLARLALGALLLALGPIVSIGASMLFVVSAILVEIVGDGTRATERAIGQTLALLAGLAWLAGAVGAVLVTTVEPRVAGRAETFRSPRVLARWGLASALVVKAIDSIFDEVLESWSGLGPELLRVGLFAVMAAGLFLGATGLMRRYEALCRRLRDRPLFDRTRSLGGTLRPTLACLLIAGLLVRIGDVVGSRLTGAAGAGFSMLQVLGCVVLVAVLVLFVAMIRFVLLSLDLRRRLHVAEAAARATDAPDETGP